jgi:hypothetical protein
LLTALFHLASGSSSRPGIASATKKTELRRLDDV